MVIARIESFILGDTLEDALERADAYVEAGADGVMLEVHPNPAEAAVDPLQPIDFRTFKELMRDMRLVAKAINREI